MGRASSYNHIDQICWPDCMKMLHVLHAETAICMDGRCPIQLTVYDNWT